MPIYEYVCRDCGKDFEVVQKISDTPLKKCEQCGGALEKVISRSAFHLKGGGWYTDGYSKKTEKPQAAETKPKEPATPKKSDTKAKTSK